MAYCSSSDVAILSQNILSGACDFSSSTAPTLSAVNQWMTSGCATIESMIKAAGYSPPSSGTTAFEALLDCNALYAAARVEMSRTNVTLARGERTRGQVYGEMFTECMEQFLAQDLTLVGLTRVAGGKLYVGGISIDQKQTEESDTDRVKPRFGRGMHDWDGTLTPNTTTAS